MSVFPLVFLVVWTPLLVAEFFVFELSRDAERKRRWFRPYLVLTGVVFLVIVGLIGAPWPSVAVLAPVVVAVASLKAVSIKFCLGCGRTVRHAPWLREVLCHGCGHPLTPSEARPSPERRASN